MNKKTTIKFSFIIDELVLPSGNFLHDVKIETEGAFIDEGIGEFEFWGKIERDVRIVFEAEYFTYAGKILVQEVQDFVENNWAYFEKKANDYAHDNTNDDEY
jgi:hypothetical protein